MIYTQILKQHIKTFKFALIRWRFVIDMIWNNTENGNPVLIGRTFTAKVYYNNLIEYYFGEHQTDDTAFIFAIIMTVHSQN